MTLNNAHLTPAPQRSRTPGTEGASRPRRRRMVAAGSLTAVALLAGSLGMGASAQAAGTPIPAAGNLAPAVTVGAGLTPKETTRLAPAVPVAKGNGLGSVTSAVVKGSDVELKTSTGGIILLSFLAEDVVRVQADPSGTLSDPANTPQGDAERTANIMVGLKDFSGATPGLRQGSTLAVTTRALRLEVDKGTTRMTLKKADGTVLWQEREPLSFGASSTTQSLEQQSGEQFIGGGMQNGRSVHTGDLINITANYDWDDDGNPNAVPYYMSSRGYGVLRDTFAPGSYDFGAAPSTTHQERRFDAVYFAGSYKQSLDDYTKLTGRPLLPPIYALEYGDADCYNRSNPGYKPSGFGDPDGSKQRTPDAAKTAAQFKANDMPAGWMLVNDGYGCEYQDLPEAVKKIDEVSDLKTGLWTERSLTNQKAEVADAGIRLRKLDVAWVGAGYRKALTGCEAAHDGIEQYSDARGTSLMVEGWAGSQRCGMQWTGDHSGNLDAVRWQVSALTGSGNSGQAFTTGDIDGIFGGSAESYVRDLQWKAFAPALYSMSGWAKTDKRPWLYGDEATKINRSYLQLRQRLMPYIYSLAVNSHQTGTPLMRSLPLEFPDDPGSYSENANTQFMLGDAYLVAPVYTAATTRNGIYLPEGHDWVDYWSGKTYSGGQVINGYDAPLEKLPVFVKAGAVVPQGITARNSAVTPEDAAITVHAYPQGSSSVNLTEDDKTSRAYRAGAQSTQRFSVTAPANGKGNVSVTVGARTGSYNGMADSRPYGVALHAVSEPSKVTAGNKELPRLANKAAFERAATGWFYDTSDAGGTVLAKVGNTRNAQSVTFRAQGSSAVGGQDKNARALVASASLPGTLVPGSNVTATVTVKNTAAQPASNVSVAPAEGSALKLNAPVAPVKKLASGATATFLLSVAVPKDVKAGEGAFAFTSTGDIKQVRQAVTVSAVSYVLYASLAAAFDSVSTSSLASIAAANFDGSGNSFSREQLEALGAKPGASVNADGFGYTWPQASAGDKDSLKPGGQRIALTGKGPRIGVLGSAAAGGGATVKLHVSYTDGTSQDVSVKLPNWLRQASGLGDAKVALSTKGRNTPAGYANGTYTYNVYTAAAAIDGSKTVSEVAVGGDAAAKVFDVKIG